MANILVVDDDVISLQIISSFLRKEGHTIQTASEGYAALEILNKEFFHLMITDAIMPNISGFDLVKTLRLNIKHYKLPIIFMTARNTKTDVVRAMDAGANDYVVKPVNLPILREKIEALLNAKGTTPSHEKVVMSVPAVYSIAMHVFEVSENGLLLESEESLPLDYKFQIKSDIFDQIKIQSPVLRVVGCESRLGEPDRVTIRTHFTNLSEKDKATLSAWIRNKKAA